MTPLDLALKIQTILERLKSGFARDWQATSAKLRQHFKELMLAAEVNALGELSKTRFNTLVREVKRFQIVETTAALAGFQKQLGDVATFAALLETVELSKIVAKKFAKPTAKALMARALANPVQATGTFLAPLLKTWPKADAARVGAVVTRGWAQNRTVTQMVREVIGTRKNNYTDGFLDTSRRHAASVMNTATQHVATSARLEVWEDNGDIVKGYIWVSTLDRRTTQQCKSLDKREFEPNKGPLPPIHINCRSTTRAKLGKEWDFLDEDATRASSGDDPGQVPSELSYYDWLKKQSPDFQDFAVGPVRGKLLRDGGLSADKFAKLNIDRNFQPLTLTEMKAIEPGAFKKAGLQ